MSSESQKSINDWADSVFGPGIDTLRAFHRACEEAQEFLQASDPQEMIEEAADTVIAMYRMASVLGYDLNDQIDRKMQINRIRQWHAAGDGTGYHIKETVR